MTKGSNRITRRSTGIFAAFVAFAGTITAGALPAAAADTIKEAIADGTIIMNARARYEHVDQQDLPQTSTAYTIRLRAGFETAEFNNMKVLVEVEHVESLGSNYNNTRNGKVTRPVIADPQSTELNRAQLTFSGFPNSKVTVGRQRINIGNQRYVGAVDWRQNEQTFDALRLDNSSIQDLGFTYIYMFNVNRIFGENHPTKDNFHLDGHVVNVTYSGLPVGTFEGYFLSLDFTDASALSTTTYGLRLSGTQDIGDAVKISYAGEYAHQSDLGANPFSYGVDYFLVEGGLAWKGIKGLLGYEVLGGSEFVGFATPLATGHKFQGWADVFLDTPVTGVEDFYVGLSYTNSNILKGLNASAIWHDFSSDKAFGSYGREINLVLNVKVHDMLTVGFKFADYNSSGFATDRQKFWLQLTSAI